MPNHFSALKRMRQTKKRSAVNRSNRGVLRASLRRIRQKLAASTAENSTQDSKDQAGALLSPTVSRIDKAVQKGLIHKNTAARLKSRLMKRLRAPAPSSAK